jgi:hypothetical protein
MNVCGCSECVAAVNVLGQVFWAVIRLSSSAHCCCAGLEELHNLWAVDAEVRTWPGGLAMSLDVHHACTPNGRAAEFVTGCSAHCARAHHAWHHVELRTFGSAHRRLHRRWRPPTPGKWRWRCGRSARRGLLGASDWRPFNMWLLPCCHSASIGLVFILLEICIVFPT